MSVFEWLFKRRREPRTMAFCPGCKADLCSNLRASVVIDRLVRFRCTCGVKSGWDFNAPVPLLITHDANGGAK